MANIIVAGDSWSVSQLVTNIGFWQDDYTAQLSVANRLRSSGHRVFETAVAGSSILRQLDTLEMLFRRDLDDFRSADYVVFGWTEWVRDTNMNQPHIRPRDVPTMPGSFLQERQQVLDRIQARFLKFSSQWPSVKFLHWGGQAPVCIDMTKLGAQHTVLYKDFAWEEFEALPNNSHLYGMHQFLSAGKMRKWTQRVFPGTSKQLANAIAFDLNARRHSLLKLAPSQYFPDGGHISFHCYTPLIDLINAHCEGIANAPDYTPKTYSEFLPYSDKS
jgi:hypothetical protein